MSEQKYAMIDGNEAVARIAYQLNEVIAIYPITPSSPIGEWADAWASAGQKNLWDTVPHVVEMQSEGGAAGAVHGALQTGSLTTTFTASQGLLLMLPNMYKIAGELTPTVFHVAARSLAAQALSIFGDHSDVMSARGTGFAMLAAGSVQEAQDFALLSTAATLRSRIPFLHFFDGFRTSHEIAKIELLDQDVMRAIIDETDIFNHRDRSLTPDQPVIRGTAQNPDVYFQARETVNGLYNDLPATMQQVMNEFADLTGREYNVFDYFGAPDAERVVVIMGSGAEMAHETIEKLNEMGEKVGLIKVRLYRPFASELFVRTLPQTVKSIAVMDRTKEPGASGEPLYLDVISAVNEGLVSGWSAFDTMPRIVGGRYGLSSKEFTPPMVKAIYDNLAQESPKNHFTVGINDDVTFTSLPYDEDFSIEGESVVRAMFFGLGSDGTVGANKNSIKIIGDYTDNYAQGYFVYDSKKSGAMTVSHLRFGPDPIRSSYLLTETDFVACHQPIFLDKFDIVSTLRDGGTFLINSPYSPDTAWDYLPHVTQAEIIEKNIKVYTIDAYKVAREAGMGHRINTVMQVCFFAISGVLPPDEAIDAIKDSIRKTYGKKGEKIVQMNLNAVDSALEHMHEVVIQQEITSEIEYVPAMVDTAPDFVRNVLGAMASQQGDLIPVSALPIDGTYPTGTTQYEKRNLAQEIPIWDPNVCIQCGKCAFVCPHAAIRIKAYDAEVLSEAPAGFQSADVRDRSWSGKKMTIQVAPADCTGCTLCVDVCPARNKQALGFKAINMQPHAEHKDVEEQNWDFFMDIPDMDRREIKPNAIRQQQVQRPLFEFSGACSGCGETPYVKLVSQLFGDRAVIANATGCSSIYGGNLPTTPWAKNDDGRGPAWSNSLFEDNAEFGLGMRVSMDKKNESARELLAQLSGQISPELVEDILNANQSDEAGIYAQRERVAILKEQLNNIDNPIARRLSSLADMLVKQSLWIIGGDGWAYDIGYGGLDHVIASGRNVNILVLDTEVYSNTGGQASKSTPLAAVAKFAAGGKPTGKKDLGLIAMTYGNVYVGSVAMGANDGHTLRTFLEAEAYEGPSIIIAYSHCIAHGIDMANGFQNQKELVNSGQWLLYRFNPNLVEQGKNPLQLDSRPPKSSVKNFLDLENRFKILKRSNPEMARKLAEQAQLDANNRRAYYEYLADRPIFKIDEEAEETEQE